ncbi:hypothetical protein FB451DRAFT_1364907 [Mycena latifolia]|nr:hypothetical protein FB451DRAFT_1364907 [Mycena latifolia]
MPPDAAPRTEYAYKGTILWNAWEPTCDACDTLESSSESQGPLRSCSGCLLAKYCSTECQRKHWSAGHKHRCHLFEADGKLSTVFAKSLGPGTLNDPTLSEPKKMEEWNFLNLFNHYTIAANVLQNASFGKNWNVAIGLSMYKNRMFVISGIALLPRPISDEEFEREECQWKNGDGIVDKNSSKLYCKIIVHCSGLSDTQMWNIPLTQLGRTPLPPGFDLHRYITHVNRGITHFHGSHLAFPRSLSDAELEAAKYPFHWLDYAYARHTVISGLKGQNVRGVINPDGTWTPLYKWGVGGHRRAAAPGETDTEGPAAFKKLLVDPSRMVRKCMQGIERFEHVQGSCRLVAVGAQVLDASRVWGIISTFPT